MLKKTLPISVIIPTLNRVNSLKDTIKSINSSSQMPSEIIIIDQSKDFIKNKANIISGLNKKNIVYLNQNEPSITKARNTGILVAKNEIILFCDDDIELEKDTILNLYNIFNNFESISLIGGMNSLASWNSKMSLESFLGYIFLKKNFFKRNSGHVTRSIFGRFPKQINIERETEWAMGFFFAVRKSLINKWQIKFDENLVAYAYSEDLDFTYRYYLKSKNENLRMIYSPKIKVKHLCSNEYRIPSFKWTLMFITHRRYLSYKMFNTVFSSFAVSWSNLGEFFKRILDIRFIEALNILKAEQICFKNRKKLKSGEIPISIKIFFKK